MSYATLILKRSISSSAPRFGKRNFRKFMLYNKRGSRIFKQQQAESPDPDIPIYKRGVRDVGYKLDGKFIIVPEMIPEFIVPDLTDCKLKPYVSYRAPEVRQTEFTSQDLFDAVYGQKIVKDFREGKLKADGNPVQASAEEELTPEKAQLLAKQTGSDIF